MRLSVPHLRSLSSKFLRSCFFGRCLSVRSATQSLSTASLERVGSVEHIAALNSFPTPRYREVGTDSRDQ